MSIGSVTAVRTYELFRTAINESSIKSYADEYRSGGKLELVEYTSTNPDSPSNKDGYAVIIHMSSNYKTVVAFSRDGKIYQLQKATTWNSTWKIISMT